MIRTVANTKAEYNIAEERLHMLMNRKEELYIKYFKVTKQLKNVPAHTNKHVDTMAEYMAELTKINPVTGLSLDDEIEIQKNKLNELKYYLNLMEYNLKHTTGIKNELYYLITVEGYSVTKAVEKVAEKYNKDTRTIWKCYYSKIKKEILKSTVKVQ